MPIANSTSPIPSTIGITKGLFTRRTARSRITPKASAGTHRLSVTRASRRSPIVRQVASYTPEAT